jgi:catechol 2,3-dioxygenase-like lactoylglutathione lyase family enzyme
MHQYLENAMTGRVQLALNVSNLEESVNFYSKLFGTEPAKLHPGYANFAITEPPLKLILLESPGLGGSLNHLGIEVADTGAVDAERSRLAQAGLASIEERDTTCCYARQNKFWVEGTPDGERWEIYTVLEDSQTFWGQDGGEASARVEASSEGAQCCASPAPASAENAARAATSSAGPSAAT